MPNSRSAAKRMRGDEKKRARNKSVKSRLKTLEKNLLSTLQEEGPEKAAESLRTMTSALDKAVKNGVIHPSKANRKKSRLCCRVAKAKVEKVASA